MKTGLLIYSLKAEYIIKKSQKKQSKLQCLLSENILFKMQTEIFPLKIVMTNSTRKQWLATLPMTGGLRQDDHYGHFQPRPFYPMSYNVQKSSLEF